MNSICAQPDAYKDTDLPVKVCYCLILVRIEMNRQDFMKTPTKNVIKMFFFFGSQQQIDRLSKANWCIFANFFDAKILKDMAVVVVSNLCVFALTFFLFVSVKGCRVKQ